MSRFLPTSYPHHLPHLLAKHLQDAPHLPVTQRITLSKDQAEINYMAFDIKHPERFIICPTFGFMIMKNGVVLKIR